MLKDEFIEFIHVHIARGEKSSFESEERVLKYIRGKEKESGFFEAVDAIDHVKGRVGIG